MTTKELEQTIAAYIAKADLSPHGEAYDAENAFRAGAESQIAITEREVRQQVWRDVQKSYGIGESYGHLMKVILGTSEVGKL